MSHFTRTVYVATLLCIAVSLTGCFGGGSTGLISVSGTITSGSMNIPVEGATVALVRKQTSAQTLVKGTQSSRVATTDRNGRFQLVGIERGTYDLKVSKEGFNPVTLTKRLDRTSTITVKLETFKLETFLAIIHFADSDIFNNYQIVASVLPGNQQVEGAEVVTPSGRPYTLSYGLSFGRERYGTWWNEPGVEEGIWEIRIQQSDGSESIHSFSVQGSELPPRPELIYPIEWTEIDTTAPVFEVSMAGKIDLIELWFYEVKYRNGFTLEDGLDPESPMIVRVDGLSGRYLIPEGLLERGKDYAWKACVIRTGGISLSYSAHSDLHYFCVGR